MRYKHSYFPDFPMLFGVDVNVKKRSIAMDFGHHTFFVSFKRTPRGNSWENIDIPAPW